MTLEIKTDAQAEAARELIAAVDKCLTHWPTSSLLTEDAQAALRAYEAQKAVKDIVLSEDELTLLKYAKLSHHETIVAMRSLRSKDLIYGGGDGNEYAISATDTGRAYLAQKPRETQAPLRLKGRTFNWVVWDKEYDIPAIYSWNEPDANDICEEMSRRWGKTTFEVREVR